jgi:PP-loop superfamily ATP-utilizing enzyme
MDNSDPNIIFTSTGCSNCDQALIDLEDWKKLEPESNDFKEYLNQFKANKDNFDLVIGLSGGIDSSYLLHILKKSNLRVQAIHIDAGWNSKIATSNIFRLTEKLKVPLKTIVIPWEPMRKLQAAYLKSGILNQDVPQDHLFTIHVKKFAIRAKVNRIASGWNYSSESILPIGWSYSPRDGTQIKHIAKIHGVAKSDLSKLEIMTQLSQYYNFNLRKQIGTIRPLNYLNYNRDIAKELLSNEYNWQDYGGKHEESRWTKFYQGYWLPKRWGIDKRKAHLSSQIISGQTSRPAALQILKEPILSNLEAEQELIFVANKLQMNSLELENLLHGPKVLHESFKGDHLMRKIRKVL